MLNAKKTSHMISQLGGMEDASSHCKWELKPWKANDSAKVTQLKCQSWEKFPRKMALGFSWQTTVKGQGDKALGRLDTRLFTLVPHAQHLNRQLGPLDRGLHSHVRLHLQGHRGHLQARCDGWIFLVLRTMHPASPPLLTWLARTIL